MNLKESEAEIVELVGGPRDGRKVAVTKGQQKLEFLLQTRLSPKGSTADVIGRPRVIRYTRIVGTHKMEYQG